jgi:hypothetical protein
MNLAVGIVALAVRSEDRRERRTLAAGSVKIPIDPDNTGVAPPATTATTQPAAGGGQPGTTSLTDPAGDTTVDGTSDPIEERRADIVRAGAVYEADRIILAMQLAQPTDPRTDPHWAGDATFASWSLDTNDDGRSDYDVQFFLDEGQIAGTVSRPGSSGPEVLCDVTPAAYNPDGYGLTVDPSCVGNPASFTYRVEMNYDTNPKDENADVAFDATPNGGWSFRVARPGHRV